MMIRDQELMGDYTFDLIPGYLVPIGAMKILV